jgi:hypothetical protein
LVVPVLQVSAHTSWSEGWPSWPGQTPVILRVPFGGAAVDSRLDQGEGCALEGGSHQDLAPASPGIGGRGRLMPLGAVIFQTRLKITPASTRPRR